jgi:hypothetical protein
VLNVSRPGRTFLLRTSILDRISEELAAEVPEATRPCFDLARERWSSGTTAAGILSFCSPRSCA